MTLSSPCVDVEFVHVQRAVVVLGDLAPFRHPVAAEQRRLVVV
ncbi:hypothetical protein ACFTY8_44755 [Streptomyces mirabilis]